MLRRGVGIGAVKKREQTQQTFAQVGASLESSQLAHLQSTLDKFRTSLEDFAFQHKQAIASNPIFRAQFHQMCLSIGVDPLACHKGFWSQLLGLGDFYFELGVQIMDVCLKERPSNGGLMKVEEVMKALKQKYKHQQNITLDDIAQSVSKLTCLGSGFVLIPIGGPKNLGQHLLKSVPLEMNVDHLALIAFASEDHQSTSHHNNVSTSPEKGCIYPSEVVRKLNWTPQRVQTSLGLLLEEGMVWIDTQGQETSYWFPSLAMQ